jgi:membrane associated rhomboid family serine protease
MRTQRKATGLKKKKNDIFINKVREILSHSYVYQGKCTKIVCRRIQLIFVCIFFFFQFWDKRSVRIKMFPRIDFPTLQSKELASLSFLHMDPACINVNALFIYYFFKNNCWILLKVC